MGFDQQPFASPRQRPSLQVLRTYWGDHDGTAKFGQKLAPSTDPRNCKDVSIQHSVIFPPMEYGYVPLLLGPSLV